MNLAKAGIGREAKEFALAGTDDRVEDAELLEGCRKGSLPAFERLYTEHGDRMRSIAANLLGNLADAEDAVQETFLKVYRAAPAFRGGARLSTWIYRILVNTCYDLLRRSRRRAEGPLPARLGPAPEEESDHALRVSIDLALRRLDPRERASFLLCAVEGFSHREAGEILDVDEGASRTLLFRAKKRLQKTLRATGALAPADAS